ncbi:MULTISPECIES: histidine kinase [Pseudomonas]|uniref:DNA-binding NtrC family response regulator n=1 Tax=Pseudomonas hunanensis TaxID=1247546 RepID=A0ACC6K658_9PSED|nr:MULTISPECIES: histidine kinase [Pseudomonas]MBP2260801.1 DNA-binding NtrC family response regulator [Pseudomonas sp. BP8]MDR6713897.1 DNA-binding NtrC family response regulator [Pseudomonas hunanensis]HDS1736803.1 histidine kinase [Pseudomonas putida]
MNRLNILIYQASPCHQITLHQACNAQGVFNVRVAEHLPAAMACLGSTRRCDLLVLDHAMPAGESNALLEQLSQVAAPKALLFVGTRRPGTPDCAAMARRQGLWVIAELPWPLSTPALRHALIRIQGSSPRSAQSEFQTVMLPAHAH